MNQRLFYSIVLLLSIFMSYTLGYIKFPYIDRNHSFFLGLLTGIVFIGLIYVIVWKWNQYQTRKQSQNSVEPLIHSQKTKSTFINSLLFGLMLILLVCCVCFYFNKIKTANQSQSYQETLTELNNQLNVDHQRSKIQLLIHLIHELDSANGLSPHKTDQNHLLNRIVALSSSLKIHKEWDLEQQLTQSISMERGLLLMALIHSNLDSIFFYKIKDQVSFYGADLRNADLSYQDLSGIMLKNANLQYANLQGANLDKANLKGADLLGVNLNKASLIGANLMAANLRWAKINEAQLEMTKLDSSDLSNATLQKTKLKYVTFISSNLNHALLDQADVSNCYLLNTNLSFANLSNTVLISDSIRSSNFYGAILHNVIIPSDWIRILKENQNTGGDYILKNYTIQIDSMRIRDSIIYYLESKN